VANRVRETGWFFITCTSRNEMIRSLHTSYVSIWASSVCFLLLFCMFSFLFVSRLIIPPVRRLVQSTEAVAGGDLDYVFPTEWLREFHSISDSMARMVGTLKNTLHQARVSRFSGKWTTVRLIKRMRTVVPWDLRCVF